MDASHEANKTVIGMKVSAELCLIPLGVGTSLSQHIAECQRVLQGYDLKAEMHAYGTNIEGEWDTVMQAIKQCHEAVHAQGAPRIFTTVKLGTRTDKGQSLEEKTASVRSILDQ